ncbi:MULTISPECIES: FAD-dependent oxidoreductase [unclassified Actinopolyspora]|uniref:FAD-dependent oxidoreductase n=1 Tax=Actinopolyspora TaxID=1849 RepID=UPI0013F67E16|nr:MULTISPECIES: FAD-dependent oxidoreductase [unclassified Actinopolyspora]NHD16124.1 FAD-dependent oxidoreductase [Actinopolyspora sp. BKK2]NHE74662.1 FAD-dependent oxidoreductase [Actinopolyspora sp. BKK1]
MPAVRSVLVIGGGSAGTATAVLLAEQGVAVDLVETNPEVTALGSGITLQGNALRVLRRLGVWEEVRRRGYPFSTLGMRAPSGELLEEITDTRTGGDDLPATLGMYRPDLARVLTDRAVQLGVNVHFGTGCTGLEQDADSVLADFDDGTSARYDLAVGADGVRSSTRRMLGVELSTRPTGMGIWRAFTPRPDSVTHTDLYYGGAAYIAGYCPVSEDGLYAYLVEDAQYRSKLPAERRLAVMRELAEHYHGPWDDISPHLDDPSRINYTWFESHLLDGPWHRGRVVLIGDAVHVCPPTLAQGAALALEDAAVLAELLSDSARVDETLWQAFTARRLERARTVVDSSVQLGQWLLDGEQGDVPELMDRVARVVGRPA